MRDFNETGLTLCRLQGQAFQRSLERCGCSSAVFIRRFMRSAVARRLDAAGDGLLETCSADDLIGQVEAEYGVSDYGSAKYGAEELYWMGYLYRYWCFTREVSSAAVFKACGARELQTTYGAYHTLDPAAAIERILEAKDLIGSAAAGYASEEEMVARGVEILGRLHDEGRYEYWFMAFGGDSGTCGR